MEISCIVSDNAREFEELPKTHIPEAIKNSSFGYLLNQGSIPPAPTYLFVDIRPFFILLIKDLVLFFRNSGLIWTIGIIATVNFLYAIMTSPMVLFHTKFKIFVQND